jgi:DNA-binding MarR family transcriptional regulator
VSGHRPKQQERVTPGDLDSVIHERVRLGITSLLAARREVDYVELRTLLKVTDGNLAAHLRVLERAGYVEVEKAFVDRTPRTTYRLSASGRKAFARHVEALASLLNGRLA